MKYFVYKTKLGEEVMPFAQWVYENGTDEDVATHDAIMDKPSAGFEALLNKYLIQNEVASVTIYEDEKLISGPDTIILPK
jgi:hypothetical protein